MTNDPTPHPDEPEIVDGLPVLAEETPAGLAEPAATPGVLELVAANKPAALVAASTFMAGALTAALVNRRRTRVVRRPVGRRKGRPVLGEVVSSNAFLVDVHVLRRD